jgi:hypothetical protein
MCTGASSSASSPASASASGSPTPRAASRSASSAATRAPRSSSACRRTGCAAGLRDRRRRAGLAGAVEVAAVHTNANASLIAGYGYAGILVAFIARQSPFAIIPVAILFGGFGAAGSLLQRRLGLPDASVQVLQGIAFVLILASEALRGSTGSASAQAARPRSATAAKDSMGGRSTRSRRSCMSAPHAAAADARSPRARPRPSTRVRAPAGRAARALRADRRTAAVGVLHDATRRRVPPRSSAARCASACRSCSSASANA